MSKICLLTAIMLLSSCEFIKYFQETPTTTPTTTTNYIISVYLESPSLQAADLSVVNAPQGSKFQAGAIISKFLKRM